MKNRCLIVLSAAMVFIGCEVHAQDQPVSSYSMGTGLFELYSKTECASGKADAVDVAFAHALHSADLLQDRAVEMRRGVRDAHAALVSRGGCRAYPASELARIRANQVARERAVENSGGEMELELPSRLGGKRTGRATYGTIAVEGNPFTVLCMETSTTEPPFISLALISPSETMFHEGNHDVAQLGAVVRLTISGSGGADTDLQYGMLGISSPEGMTMRGSFTGIFRSDKEIVSGSFTAVRSEDPCGLKQELARSRLQP